MLQSVDIMTFVKHITYYNVFCVDIAMESLCERNAEVCTALGPRGDD